MNIVKMPDAKKVVPTNPELRRRANSVLEGLIQEFYEKVPYATHLMTSKTPDLEYYKRHTVETILRLRMKRVVDALAIKYFTHNDPVRARDWCHYCEDEMLHDVQFFLKDLQKVGVKEEEVYATEPFFSTKLLIGYYQWGMEYEGTPLALIASVYFMEFVTTRTQPAWLDNLEKSLGKEKVRGARGHVNVDVADDHDDFVWNVLMSLVRTPDEEDRMIRHLEAVGRLFAAYFTELHRHTIEKAGQQAEPIDRLSNSLRAIATA
jgi:hypothetical protein